MKILENTDKFAIIQWPLDNNKVSMVDKITGHEFYMNKNTSTVFLTELDMLRESHLESDSTWNDLLSDLFHDYK